MALTRKNGTGKPFGRANGTAPRGQPQKRRRSREKTDMNEAETAVSGFAAGERSRGGDQASAGEREGEDAARSGGWTERVAAKWRGLPESRRRVAANVAWAMLGKAAGMAGVLFVGILVGRYLGPEKYGLMNYVISFAALFGIVAEFGLGHIEIRELSKEPEARDAILGTCFVLRLGWSAAAYALMVGTACLADGDAFTRKAVAAYGLSLFALPFNAARNYFTSIVENEWVVKSQLARTAAGACIKAALLWFRADLKWFILAAGFDFWLLAAGYAGSYRARAGRMRDWRFEARRAKYLTAESFPQFLSGAAVVAYQRIDQVMIKHMVDEAGVGYFATAGMFANVVLFLPTVLVQTVTPLLVRLKKRDEAAYRRRADEMAGGVAWLSAGLSLAVALGAPWLVGWTYGAEYAAAVPVLQVLTWKTVGMALSTAAGHLIIIEGLQKWAAVRNAMGCAVCVGLNWWALPRWGVAGAAWTTLATTAVTGWLANLAIPPYHGVFRLQCRALLLGWRVPVRALWRERRAA